MKFSYMEKGVALLWICFNMLIMAHAQSWNFKPFSTRMLYPFETNNFLFYDLSEFISYSLIPIILYISLKYIINGISDLREDK